MEMVDVVPNSIKFDEYGNVERVAVVVKSEQNPKGLVSKTRHLRHDGLDLTDRDGNIYESRCTRGGHLLWIASTGVKKKLPLTTSRS